jgi:hypothetical protein
VSLSETALNATSKLLQKKEREQRKDNHLPIAIESERKKKITGSGNHLSTGCKMDLTTGDPIIRFVWKRNGRTGEVSLFFRFLKRKLQCTKREGINRSKRIGQQGEEEGEDEKEHEGWQSSQHRAPPWDVHVPYALRNRFHDAKPLHSGYYDVKSGQAPDRQELRGSPYKFPRVLTSQNN